MVDTRVAVMVLHLGGYGEIAIARTLGRLGVPVYLVGQEEIFVPVPASRYWSAKMWWDFSCPEEQSTTFLLDVGARIRAGHGLRAILLTTAARAAIFIERNCDVLQKEFTFLHPAQSSVSALLNKWEMHLLAEAHGIPHLPQRAQRRSTMWIRSWRLRGFQ